MANVMLSLDDDLIARLDAEASEAGLPLSDYLEKLLAASQGRDLSPRHDGPEVAAVIERIRAVVARYDGDEDSTELVREERDTGH